MGFPRAKLSFYASLRKVRKRSWNHRICLHFDGGIALTLLSKSIAISYLQKSRQKSKEYGVLLVRDMQNRLQDVLETISIFEVLFCTQKTDASRFFFFFLLSYLPDSTLPTEIRMKKTRTIGHYTSFHRRIAAAFIR